MIALLATVGKISKVYSLSASTAMRNDCSLLFKVLREFHLVFKRFFLKYLRVYLSLKNALFLWQKCKRKFQPVYLKDKSRMPRPIVMSLCACVACLFFFFCELSLAQCDTFLCSLIFLFTLLSIVI